MIFYFDYSILLQLFPVVISLLLILYFSKYGVRTLLHKSYMICQALILIWSLGQLLEEFAISVEDKWFFVKMQYFSICFITLSWLLFCIIYTEHKLIKNKYIIGILFIPPLLFYISVLTNGYHGLFYTEFNSNAITRGIYFWLHVAISYIYSISGIALLTIYAIKHFGYIRKQCILLIIGMFISIFSNFLVVSNYIKISFDITPVSFSISLMIFTFATFKYKFLNINPIALTDIFNNMNEAIIVIDRFNKVIT